MYELSDVLVDPYQEGVESVLGSFVYFGNSPQEVLKSANEGKCYAMFSDLDDGGFFVDGPCDSGPYQCIIKRTDMRYRKFKDISEFLEHAENKPAGFDYHYLIKTGIWLRDYSGCLYQVTMIDGLGVQMNGVFLHWQDLLDDYLFLDGTLCGVFE